ncbi:MAG: sulfite exporter TauE/SafE family protein [Verrucomicrobiota bacterium JB023]|nr:sulfite exporter TauE/SafE family protein [Verrucomicrobiota bacterium JB023]
MKLAITALIVGLAAGLISALCGVGGGILLVPAFVIGLGLDQKNAVATSLAIVVISAGIGTLNHTVKQTGLIEWKLVALTALGTALASWFGTDLMRSLQSATLTKIFGVALVIVGARMLFEK